MLNKIEPEPLPNLSNITHLWITARKPTLFLWVTVSFGINFLPWGATKILELGKIKLTTFRGPVDFPGCGTRHLLDGILEKLVFKLWKQDELLPQWFRESLNFLFSKYLINVWTNISVEFFTEVQFTNLVGPYWITPWYNLLRSCPILTGLKWRIKSGQGDEDVTRGSE